MAAVFGTSASFAAALALAMAAGPALADEPAIASDPQAAIIEAATVDLPASATAVGDEILGDESAMARIEIGDIMISDQDLTGVVEGNTASGVTTGNNSIADYAFSGVSGFATAVQNTGNNVLIQNSTIVNVTLEP